ncbi:MAG: Rieske (2Fe-2S) protein [Halobacteriales archaeon]
MTEHVVADTDEIDDRERLVVQLEGREIGIINIDGEYKAFTNWCAHQSGPLFEGKLSGTAKASFDPESLEVSTEWVRDDKVMTCPWHGWEYDVETGECLSRKGISLPEHEVTIRDGKIVVTL